MTIINFLFKFEKMKGTSLLTLTLIASCCNQIIIISSAKPLLQNDDNSDDTAHNDIELPVHREHRQSQRYRFNSRQPVVNAEPVFGEDLQLGSAPVSNSRRQLKNQYNNINIRYDEDQGYRQQPYNPYRPSYYDQPPYAPYYPSPPPYYQSPPTSSTTTTTTTVRPGPPQPIGYMLIDTYHSPRGQSYSRPIAFFTASG